MKTDFIRFPARDGLQLHGLLYSPDQPTDKAVLHIHGMAGNFYENGFLDSIARTLTDNGWAFFAPNTRGHDYVADFMTADGSYRRIGNAHETFAESEMDIAGALDVLEQKGYTTIVLEGHSLGGAKVAYYLGSTSDARVSKVILASPADMVGLAEMDPHFPQLVTLAKMMVADGHGRDLLPFPVFAEDGWEGYLLSAKTGLDLSLRDNPVDVISTYDPEKPSLLGQISVPMLVFYGTDHESVITEPQSVLEIIKTKAKNAPSFDSFLIDGAPHSYAEHEAEVAEKVLTWLQN